EGIPNETTKKPAKPSGETVALPIAKVEIPAGTQLTKDLLLDKFEFKDVVAPAPGNAVLNLAEQEGKILQHPLVANQWLPKSYVGDFAPKGAPPKDAFDPKDGPDKEPAIGAAGKKTHDMVIATGSGHRIYRFEWTEKKRGGGEFDWVLVGEVNKGPDA